jgi:hypothetical protein
LPGAISLLASGLLLLIAPTTGISQDRALPDDHFQVFRYALRSGVLPIASLFSGWNGELARQRNLLKKARRSLPIGTGAVLTMDMYGILVDPKGHDFFLVLALASMVVGVTAFSTLTIRLQNILAVEERLRLQTQLLEMPHS